VHLLSCPPIQERNIVTPRLAHLAVVGTLAAAFSLAGCGRKGPLDPPPGAGVAAPAPSSPNVGFSPVPERPARPAPVAFDAEGRPLAPAEGPKKRLPIDWLLD
jgi:predicted small lipoprotein YifL